MNDTQPTLSDVYAVVTSLIRATVPIGDANLNQLAKRIGEHAAALTVDSAPEDVRAIIDLTDTLEAALHRLAEDFGAEVAEG